MRAFTLHGTHLAWHRAQLLRDEHEDDACKEDERDDVRDELAATYQRAANNHRW
jgi:hypothetical protein